MFGSLSFIVALRSYVEGTTSISSICKQTCVTIANLGLSEMDKTFLSIPQSRKSIN